MPETPIEMGPHATSAPVSPPFSTPRPTASDPPPPPPPTNWAPGIPRLRAGQLTVAWQIMLTAGWTAAFFAFAAVWKTSEEIGIGTWWLGARAQPQPLLIRVVPFALTLVMGLVAIYNLRRAASISLVGSLLVALIAVFDISRSGGLAAIEFAIAASLLLVSIGARIGAVRIASPA